jgi:hypothetical protein
VVVVEALGFKTGLLIIMHKDKLLFNNHPSVSNPDSIITLYQLLVLIPLGQLTVGYYYQA